MSIPAPTKLTTTTWLIIIIASIGFAFDIYELLMLPLIVGPALQELIGAAPGSPEFGHWVGRLFYIPAVAGGIFGLLGGYLTDLLGRRRVLTYSILLYAFSAFAAGYSTSVEMLLFFRCLVFIGVCVEFVAAVAWLAELFPNPKQREKVLGYTQAFSSIGGLLVAVAYGLCVKYAGSLPAIHFPDWLTAQGGGTVMNEHAAWRYTLMSGVIPAIPLILIRPFLPESPSWSKKKAEGTLRRPSIKELFSTPLLRRTTLVTTAMVALSYAAAFGAIQHIPRMIPGLPEVKAQAAEAASKVKADNIGKPDDVIKKLSILEAKKSEQAIAANVTKIQEVGGLFGRFALAALAVVIISRRKLIRIFQIPGMFVMLIVFAWAAVTGLTPLSITIFFAGFFTVAQFSFWGNYLPRVFPIHLRGTGESFSANIGGRLIGTSFAWLTTTLAATNDPSQAPMKLAYVAAAVGFGTYLLNLILSFFLPEPPAQDAEE